MNRYERLNEERKMIDTRKRVAAYCRVSTDNEDQANSFESQQRYFKQYIERNPDWELYEIFADEGISGTNTKKRKEFNRMIACAKNGDFDLIITKEISRFARNTLDSIYYTRDLKKHGVGVIFMNDNINTLDGDAELRLAIMSSIAQEESRETSERVKWGQKRQMEQGVVFGRSMLGYDVKNGKMTINEEGAKIVRLIFHKFVNEGKGTHVIARELREEGIRPMRVKEWQNTVILRIIRNEKYCGDLVQKKTYTPDFLSHEKKYNRGQEEFVIIKDHHEPIISRELFEEANRILDERSLSQEGKAKHSNRYPFSGKIKCGCCGASYVARYKTRKDGSRYKAWRCNEAAKHGSPHVDKAGNQVGCIGASIRNEDATHIMFLVTKELKLKQTKIIKNLISIIQSIIAMDTTGTDIEKLKAQIQTTQDKRTKLIDIYMSGDITKEEFSAARSKCDTEIKELQSVIDSFDKQQTMIRQQQELVQEISDAINEIVGGVEYDDEFYKHILDKMVVNDKDNIDVYLNLLPIKWSYTVAKASKKALAPERNISGASVGTEELAHMEIICAMVYQLTKNLDIEEAKAAGFDAYYIDHTAGIWPQAASSIPFTAKEFQSKGDAITDLTENLAAEQKARTVYDNLLRMIPDPEIREPLKFLRAREIVHFQRFGEANREDCSKIPKARKAHKFSTFGKSLSIRTFAGHRHEPPYLLLYLKMKIIHEIGQAAFSYN